MMASSPSSTTRVASRSASMVPPSRVIKIDRPSLRLQAIEEILDEPTDAFPRQTLSSRIKAWWTPFMTTDTSRDVQSTTQHQRRRRRSRTTSQDRRQEPQFQSNVVVSSKYTAVNFVPRVLLAQVQRPSNMYFLFIAVLQSIKEVSNTNGVPTILLPLTIVFICSMIKEALEDRERHRADAITNSRMVLVLSALGEWEQCKWGDLRVGDIVKVQNGETIPADLFVLSTEEPHDDTFVDSLHEGTDTSLLSDTKSLQASPTNRLPTGGNLGYIETKSLDGETNLKIRSAIPFVSVISRTPSDLLRLRGTIDCEPPNNRINSFEGTFSVIVSQELGCKLGLNDDPNGAISNKLLGDRHSYQLIKRADEDFGLQFPMTSRQMMLRTCVLRNTTSVTGVVVFTGHETKVFCSNTEPTVKSSSVEKRLNGLIIGVVLIQQVICALGALLGALWMITNGDAHWYLKTHIHTSDVWNKGVSFPYEELVKLHLRYFIIMQNFVPISLNVSLEFVKYWQAYFMEQDIEMYDEVSDTPAMVRSSALNEDLGRVHHIFTDKTGTLTMNLMLFRYCMIGGKHYGGEISDKDMEGSTKVLRDSPQFVEFDPTDLFADLQAGGAQATRIELFLRHLALCHTLIPARSYAEMCSATVPEYSASSPDEQALVAAAAFCNVRFVHRTPSSMTLLEPGQETRESVYTIRNVLEFDSDRKRMSVIIETPGGELLLLCKGADNVVLERLRIDAEVDVDRAFEQLSMYAKAGMRTLCLAYKVIDKDVYSEWNQRFQQASTSMDELVKRRHGHPNAIDSIMNEIEQDMELLGVTAVQDKLQVGVPKTLELLEQTNIKIWTLTGDKMETAVNIGYACNLLSNKMIVKTISCEDYVSTVKALQDLLTWHTQATALHNKSRTAKSRRNSPSSRRRRPAKRTAAPSTSWFGAFVDWFSPSSTAGGRSKRRNSRRNSLRGVVHDSDGDIEDDDANEYGSLLRKGSTGPEHQERWQAGRERFQRSSPLAVALVIEGSTLEFVLRPRLRRMFYDLSKLCQSVICCRVSPKQKSDVVELIREFEPQSVTLAIGDGANDVGMIQAAHVGVGISGQEGTQAVNSSDYAIAQFRFLQRLLLVHGRWAYRRVAKLMSYMLYKNVTYVLTTFWFGTYSGFSGQPLIIDIAAQSFNVLYTSLPLVLFAVFDQDISSQSAAAFPALYSLGQRNVLLRPKVFWPWIVNGIWHSIVIFFISTWAFEVFSLAANPTTLARDGKNDGIVTLGLVVFTNLVLVVNFKLCLETFLLTWQFLATVSCSILLWFVVGNLIAAPHSRVTHAIGELTFIQRLPSFWLICLLVCSVSLLRDTIWKMLRRLTFPSTYHILQEREMLRLRNSPRSLQREQLQKSYPWEETMDVQDIEVPTTTSVGTPQLVEYAKLLRPFENERDSFRRSSPLAESLMSSTVRARGSFHQVDRDGEADELFDSSTRVYEGPATTLERKNSNRDQYLGYAFSEDENVDSDIEAAAASTRQSSPRSVQRKQTASSFAETDIGTHATTASSTSPAKTAGGSTSSANRKTFKKMIKSVRGQKNA